MNVDRFVVVAIFLTASRICSAQSSATDLAIAIAAPHKCVKPGSSMKVKIVLTNTSGHDVSYRVVATGRWSGWEGMSVRDWAGNLLPEKLGPFNGSVFSGKGSLGAANSIEKVVDVAKEYDLSKPGKYAIEVWALSGERDRPARVIVCVKK